MFIFVTFVFKSVSNFFCRNSCIYAIWFCIVCYYTSSCYNTSISYMNSTHDDCAVTNPNIITDISNLIIPFPRIIFVSDLACQSDWNSYLLVVMVISADNANMIGNYYIISNNTIGFNRRIFSNVKIISYNYFIFTPNEHTSSTMKIFPDMVSAPYGVF